MKTLFPIVAVLAGAAFCSHATAGLTLQSALQTTVENNPAILQAKAKLEQAAGRRLVLRAVALPDATIGVVGGVQGGKRAGVSSFQPFGFGYGTSFQPLFDAKIPASYRRGDIEVLIAQQQLNIAMQEQLHATRLAFYSALYNRSLHGLREQQQERLAENAASQQARYEAGLVDRTVLTSAQVQRNELNPRVESAQRGYGDALLKLSEAMGSSLESNASLPEPEGELTLGKVDVDLAAETATALERRADLQLARLLIRAAGEDERIVKAGYYPLITATAAGELIPVSGIRRESQGSPRRVDDIISSEVRAGMAYTWRVIDNGKVYGAAMKQHQIREINEIELRKLEAEVPRNLARLRNTLQAIADKQSDLSMATAAAQQNAKIVQQNLLSGVVSQLDYRLTESTLLETRSGLVSLAYQQRAALAEWERATGRYFQFSDDSAQKLH
jgi:outer membrane protein TolC